MNRRTFFKKILLKRSGGLERELVRPPYNINKSSFLRCVSCPGPCITACENKIIYFSDYNTPYIDFNIGACIFCNKCWQACEKGVLEESGPAKIGVSLEINRYLCLSWNAKECTICESSCPEKAILFYNRQNPYIDDNSCTGCGFCLPACPDKAISIVK